MRIWRKRGEGKEERRDRGPSDPQIAGAGTARNVTGCNHDRDKRPGLFLGSVRRAQSGAVGDGVGRAGAFVGRAVGRGGSVVGGLVGLAGSAVGGVVAGLGERVGGAVGGERRVVGGAVRGAGRTVCRFVGG